MAQTKVALVNRVELMLEDSSNTIFTVTEIEESLAIVLPEVSEYVPFERSEVFSIESRTGSATSTTAGSLVDSQGQFVSGDVEKVIYNTTDKTWAIVTAYTDANTLVLSKDIMVSGENYKMFNQKCRSDKEIYIGDVTDFIDIARVEYPTMQSPPRYRNYELRDNRQVLLLGIDFTPDDSSDTDADKEVFVEFQKVHRISRLTDLAGALTAAAAAGATSLPIDGMGTTETVQADTELTVAGIRGTYRVTADVTMSSGAGTLTIYPGLESAAENNDVVTFIGSTLTPALEPLVARLTAGRAAIFKATNFLAQINTVAVTTLGAINTALALVNAEVDQAVTDLDNNRANLNAVTEGGGALEAMQFGMASLRVAQAYSGEATGDIAEAQTRLQVAAAGRALEAWGRAQVNHALNALRQMARSPMYVEYTRYR